MKNYSLNQICKVIANEARHEFKIGEEVKIIQILFDKGFVYAESVESGEKWYAYPDDLEEIETS